MRGSPESRPLATKHLNHIIYCQRGLLLREFVTLCGTQDMATAVKSLTGESVGHQWEQFQGEGGKEKKTTPTPPQEKEPKKNKKGEPMGGQQANPPPVDCTSEQCHETAAGANDKTRKKCKEIQAAAANKSDDNANTSNPPKAELGNVCTTTYSPPPGHLRQSAGKC